VQAYVEECVTDAANAAQQEQSDARIAERFLNHRDQKFRLSYILGSWASGSGHDEGESDDLDGDYGDDVEIDSYVLSDDEAVSELERRSNHAIVLNIIDRIKAVANEVSSEISRTLELSATDLTKEGQDAYSELLGEEFEGELYGKEEFHNLVQDVLDMIGLRFARLESGSIH